MGEKSSPSDGRRGAVRQPFRSRFFGVLLIAGAAILVGAPAGNMIVSLADGDLYKFDIVLVGIGISFAMLMVPRGFKMMTRDAVRHLAGDGSRGAVRQPFRSKFVGVLLIASAAILLGATAGTMIVSLANGDFDDSDIFLVGTGIAFCMIVVPRGFKMMTRDAARLLAEDARRPVVFLRPFNADEQLRSSMPLGLRRGGRSITNFIVPTGQESTLTGRLRAIGPVVAIGAPGEKLATLGAARMYLADDEWQGKVDELLKVAAAVVLQPETSVGTRWEIMRVANSIDARRVLLVVPNPAHRPLGYARIRALVEADFPVPLPVDCPDADLFMFDGDGRPVPLNLSKKSLKRFVLQVQSLTPHPASSHA